MDLCLPQKSQQTETNTLQNAGTASSECLCKTVLLNLFGVIFSIDFRLHFLKRVCGEGTLEWMMAAKAANLQVQGKEQGGIMTHLPAANQNNVK